MPDKSPINQAARKALLQLKRKPWPNYPIVQLLDWSIREYLERPKPGSRGEEMLEMWERIVGWPPREMMRLFEENHVETEVGEPSPLLDLCTQEKPVPPEDLIEEAWEQLDTWMTVNGLWADSPHPEQAGL
jgi:hypothetical protein